MLNEQFLKAKDSALNKALEKFKLTKRGSFKILKLIKVNINELITSGLNMKEQVEIINTALEIKIAYSTYKSFYYSHISKSKNITKIDDNNKEIKIEASTDIFADLK